ncbi:phosphoribosylformylglycinamidine synthase [Diaphorina citri]|uniref:60S ribosomal protein L21 n=1 Tax=Diaphorina citri TaxID=121845 RepID=A0A3Q0JCW1_DIACI|nr:phosphoribosylformylglycinamidine synthase [Diaphorina citri]
MAIIRYYSKPGIGAGEKTKKLKAVPKVISDIESELCYNIEISRELTPVELDKLHWILNSSFECRKLSSHTNFKDNSNVIEVGPRLNFSTPFCSNVLSICQSIQLHSVTRFEVSTRYKLISRGHLSRAIITKCAESFYDRMTECVYSSPLTSFNHGIKPDPWFYVDVMGKGKVALQEVNQKLGLAFDEWDLEYYTDIFRNKLKRNPTSVECFDLAQSNSEHSRHWFFKGKMIVDGIESDKCLFEMIMDTTKHSNQNNVIKFNDNSSAIQGYRDLPAITPTNPGAPGPYTITNQDLDIIFTAETHNFPTGVSPFSGATTGTGGRIRDVQAVGRGGNCIAGTAGYCVGNLNIPGYKLPWEDEQYGYPNNFATPLNILIEASNGASDYGNIEPCYVLGFARSYGQHCNGERREWIKPIMFSGGIGTMKHELKEKASPNVGMEIVKVGGPVYRIGVGGGSASSVELTIEMSNVLKEIVEPVGAVVWVLGSLVISTYAPCPDIRQVVTPDIKSPRLGYSSSLLWIDLSCGQHRVGGSALSQVLAEVRGPSPDVEDAAALVRAFNVTQRLIQDGQVLSGHDISDGGLLICLLEMDVGANSGVAAICSSDGRHLAMMPHPERCYQSWQCGVAAICSSDGRHLAMMPHPERCYQSWQCPYPSYPTGQTSPRFTPWVMLFQNAYDWNAEKQFVAEVDDIEPGTEWERIAKLCDFNPKVGRTNKDPVASLLQHNMDAFGDNFDDNVDPAAEFLAREQNQLAGLEDELQPAVAVNATINGAPSQSDFNNAFEFVPNANHADLVDSSDFAYNMSHSQTTSNGDLESSPVFFNSALSLYLMLTTQTWLIVQTLHTTCHTLRQPVMGTLRVPLCFSTVLTQRLLFSMAMLHRTRKKVFTLARSPGFPTTAHTPPNISVLQVFTLARAPGFPTTAHTPPNISVLQALNNVMRLVSVGLQGPEKRHAPCISHIVTLTSYISTPQVFTLARAPGFPTTAHTPPNISVLQALNNVMRLVSVGSKRFLTNKVDRCVTGLIAQQQCVGPLHTPLADVAVVALVHNDLRGAATSIGEQPIKGLVDPKRGARMAVAEALTNLVFAKISDLKVGRFAFKNHGIYDHLDRSQCLPIRYVDDNNKITEDYPMNPNGSPVCQSQSGKPGHGAVQKGMPFKDYHGKTGRVFNVTQHAVGVIVNKRVRTRIIPKRINVRIEHIKHSKCREDFLKRVKENLLGTVLCGRRQKRTSNMTNSKGYRRGTRDLFSRPFRRHGTIPLSVYMKVYKVGDIVDIKCAESFYDRMTECVYSSPLTSFNHGIKPDPWFYVDVMGKGKCAESFYDRMTECVYSSPLTSFNHGIKPDPWFYVDVMGKGKVALQEVNQKLGLAFDEWDLEYYTDIFRNKLKRNPTSVECFDLAQSNSEHSRHWFFKISVAVNNEPVLNEDLGTLFLIWERTSYELEKLQMNARCADEEYNSLVTRIGPKYQYQPVRDDIVGATLGKKVISIAVLREEGINGDREMSAMAQVCGFEVWDITVQDLLENKITLDRFKGLVFPGGFSYADALGSAKGWAASLLLNEGIKTQLNKFIARSDTFSFGVCNGCQLMNLLGWFSVSTQDKNNLVTDVMLSHNNSERFECRYSTVKIMKSPAIMLRNLESSVLGVWIAHGEGRFAFKNHGIYDHLDRSQCLPIRYVDDNNKITEDYPMNPNGSPGGVAAICSSDGRHLAMMPHPERCYQSWQCPYPSYPTGQTSPRFTPWVMLFQNAYDWCVTNPEHKDF